MKLSIYPRLIVAPKQSFFLFGPRGVGKSTWLKEQFPKATLINLLHEKTYQEFLENSERFVDRLRMLPTGSRVVVDEIQRLPHLLNEVHRLIEDQKLIFALSGSSARKLRKLGTNLLGGRALRREMFPLLPEELGDDFNIESILQRGSLPLVLAQGGDQDALEAYVQTYLKEEIQAEGLVRNLQGFARFLPVVALFHGQVLNASNLARDAGVARTTILGYLDILEDTLLAFRLSPYEGRLRVKEKSHPKLYWADPGIVRAARKSYGPVLESEKGALFEGWIASVLRAYQSYKKMFDSWNYWGSTGSQTIEVDFLLWRGSELVAVEAKATKRLRPEHFKGLKAFKSSFHESKIKRSIIVHLGEQSSLTADGIEVLSVEKFLQELQQGTLI